MPKRDDSGYRHRSMPSDGIFNGMTAPLWDNPGESFFKIQFYQSCAQGFLFEILLVYYLSSQADCAINLKTTYSINNNLIYLFALVNLFFMTKQYATDCQWANYVIGLLVVNVIQTTMLLVTLYQVFLNYNSELNPNIPCSGSQVFTSPVALCLLINAAGIILLLIQSYFSMFQMYIIFYISNNVTKFVYKKTREVVLLD